MVAVAALCVLLGTWQIARESSKHTANDDLRRNAHLPVAPVTSVLPLLGTGQPPTSDAVRYRHVTATGSYDSVHQALVRQRSVDGQDGYLVLTPLRTPEGTLLVVRGLLAATPTAAVSAPPVPVGQVSITGRVQPAESGSDRASLLPAGQIETINPQEQQARIGSAMFAGFVELDAEQSGAQDLVAIPTPDLSNPAGGAVEPQHIAYVIQWYLFAALALAAPLVMARAEGRRTEDDELDAEPSPNVATDERAIRLADRYGRSLR